MLPVAVAAVVLGAGCGGASDESGGGAATAASGGGAKTTLSLVAFSTPEVVYDELIPDFQKTAAGKGVGFKTSYGASGEQSRAVEAGLKADVVNFSLAPDVDRLVKDGLVAGDWTSGPTKGIATNSVVAFIVRKGNPKHITGWDDLLKPGVKVVTPNPFTSGAAKWNILGAYQHGGITYVDALIKQHVTVQPKSGRDALQTFTGGEGDVLISYEYEYTTAVRKGQGDVKLVVPDDTLLIENPIAVTKNAPPAAKAFVDYVLSPAGQQHFADWGYRPVDHAVFEKNKSTFATPSKVETVADLGGWSKVNDELFDSQHGSVAKIEEEAGVSTAK
jgi:sulfate transport system substrate-binding protein